MESTPPSATMRQESPVLIGLKQSVSGITAALLWAKW